MSELRKVSRALISVSDKTGIVEFARTLNDQGVELLSTGGTFKLLKEQGIHVVEVSQYTGFPEMMDGRVKTLHPKVHGGILGRRGTDEQVMDEHGIKAIDMVVVNLYPFASTVADPNCDLPTAIENIDIGGPTMVRSAAKNHRDVAIVVNASDYQTVTEEMQENQGQLGYETRYQLMVKAFEHTAAYDGMIANHFGRRDTSNKARDFSDTYNVQYVKTQEMRYGENPHQKAAFYTEENPTDASVSTATQIQGKELSFNNIADTDAALKTVKQFDEPACVIVKHANPCGVAIAVDISTAYELAFATDPESAFGGIIAFNRELDAATATAICEKQFVEVIIATDYSGEALDILKSKKNIRVLKVDLEQDNPYPGVIKKVSGGILIQSDDSFSVPESSLVCVSKRQASEEEMGDLMFAWKVAKFVKSNAIVYARNKQTIGIGAGQMSRVISADIANLKASEEGLEVKNAVMASDAFFPFRDGIDKAASSGIAAIIQPGGSIRGQEVIAAADENDMAMVFTGTRHFRH